jgi:hypothetical protein
MNVTSFKGLNNVADPLRLGPEWLVQADNVNISNTGALVRRKGISLVRAGAFSSAYSTIDFSRMYIVDAGALKTFEGTVLVSGLAAAPMFWCEVNNQVFYNNGVNRGIILPDNTVIDWAWPTPPAPTVAAVTGSLPAGHYQVRCSYVLPDGRETGTSDAGEITLGADSALQLSAIPQVGGWKTNVYIAPANSEVYQLAATTANSALVWNSSPDQLGRDLLNIFLDPLPADTSVIQHWKGRIYAAMWMPAQDQTAVWFTEPLAFHLFNLNSNFFMVPGRVNMLAPHSDALLVGTAERVYAYDGKLTQLATYGVTPGQHWAKDDERILFWTTRGLCSSLPFDNLTEKSVSFAPGVSAGGTVVLSGGQKRYVVALRQGGTAFNPY